MVAFAEKAATYGKVVIVAALVGTYQRNGFPDILELIPRAEKITFLHAICKLCKETASFTLRIDGGVNLKSIEFEAIGSEETYMPVCRECHDFKTKEIAKNSMKR